MPDELGMASRTRVVLCHPPQLVERHLATLRAVDPALDVLHIPYEDAPGVRSRRTEGTYRPGTDEVPPSDDLAAALSTAEVVVGLDLPQQLRSLAPRLRWIQAIGAGTGYLFTLDLPAGVIVTSATGLAGPSIAEFVMGRLLAHWKRFDRLAEIQRQRRWVPSEGRGRTLAGTTMLIVGLGGIGTELARRARAFDLRVMAVRARPAPHPDVERVVGPDRLADVVGEADIVVLCAPATEATASLFDSGMFALMKPGAVLVNVARGALVDEEAMLDALRRGHLGAAILDVVRNEPLPADSPLWDEPGVVLSPHASSAPDRMTDDLVDLLADNLTRWLRGEPLRNLVDPARGY